MTRHQDGMTVIRLDSIAQEVEVRVFIDGREGHPLMCSPWDIEELVVGNIFMHGQIDSVDDIASIVVDPDTLEAHVSLSESRCLRGNEGVSVLQAGRGANRFSLSADEVVRAMEKLEGDSALFHRTGGVHCAALLGGGGNFICWFEDIGRHNAIDKLAGWCLLNSVDPKDKPLVFSGRVPCEIISKVARLGCPVIISPGAPTSMSVEIARESDIALIGFAKKGRFNVYSAESRIRPIREIAAL